MSTKVGGFQNRPVHVGTDKSVSRARNGQKSSTEPAVASKPIRITDQALQLAALEQALQSMPIVNEARVAEFRSAIEEGRYEVAPERIAAKLLHQDRDLRAAQR